MDAGNHQLLVCWQTLQRILPFTWPPRIVFYKSAQTSDGVCLLRPPVPTSHALGSPRVPESRRPRVPSPTSQSPSPRPTFSNSRLKVLTSDHEWPWVTTDDHGWPRMTKSHHESPRVRLLQKMSVITIMTYASNEAIYWCSCVVIKDYSSGCAFVIPLFSSFTNISCWAYVLSGSSYYLFHLWKWRKIRAVLSNEARRGLCIYFLNAELQTFMLSYLLSKITAPNCS